MTPERRDAIVRECRRMHPSDIWNAYGSRTGMHPVALWGYMRAAAAPGIIVLGDVRKITPVKLSTLRTIWTGWTVPQSFRYMSSGSMERLDRALETHS